MNLKYNFKDKLDEISFDQAIFSNKIYRKVRNLDNSYFVYSLEYKNNNFIWEKTNNFKLSQGYECISFNNLVYANGNNGHITIYNIEGTYAIKLMIYTCDNVLIWDILNIPFDINNINTYSLLDFPTHIKLISEYSENCLDDTYDPYDIINDFEPLHGWDNLLERSSDKEDTIILEKDIDMNDESRPLNNFISEDDNLDNISENINEEMRIDPYDGKLYSYNEFVNYYGGETEWNFMESSKLLLREEYYKFTNTFCHLSDKKFIFLFNEFQKTY